MRQPYGVLIAAALVCPATGCQEQPASGLATVKMHIGSQTFVVEVARSHAQQEKGLMQRDAMPADHGMIFMFPRQEVQGFWMKNTRFPLDILFLDTAGKVVSIRQMQAYDENTTSSTMPARYAIELSAGAAAGSGVKVGDVLEIPAAAQVNGGK